MLKLLFLILMTPVILVSKTAYILVPHEEAHLSPAIYAMLEEEGYVVKETFDALDLTDCHLILAMDINDVLLERIAHIPRARRFFLTSEPPIIDRIAYDPKTKEHIGKIFLQVSDYVDNETTFKIFYPVTPVMTDQIPPFHEKKLATMCFSNKNAHDPRSIYGTRQGVARYFTARQPDDFDLYGRYWEGWKLWKGTVMDKIGTIKQYKFCFAYENMTGQRGYITEKIFDSMIAGCVPIYLGATDIEDYIPKTCFIDRRDYPTFHSLVHTLNTMDEATYNTYIEAIREFLSSPAAYTFTPEALAETIRVHVKEAEKGPLE